jgi:hypothetical protein
MLGASQFVNVVLFQFSGPDNFSSAQPLLRSFSCASAVQSSSSSRARRVQIYFNGTLGKTCALLRRNWSGQQMNIHGERAANCGAVV